ncbi:MAG: hypothetical protein ACRERU_05270 [Methylococcales bacterium]
MKGPLEDRGSVDRPTLAVFHDKLYMAWRGVDDDKRLFWTTFDEATQDWLPPKVTKPKASHASPALAVFKDKFYMAYRGADNKRLGWAIYTEAAEEWLPHNELNDAGSEWGPAFVVFEDKLFMFWTGEDTQAFFFSTFDGQGEKLLWAGPRRVVPPLFSYRSPGLVVFHDQLFIFQIGTLTEFSGEDAPFDNFDTQLCFTRFDGNIPFRTNFLSATSASSPAVAVFFELTRSLKLFLQRHGFNPSEGVRQVGRGSVKSLTGLA